MMQIIFSAFDPPCFVAGLKQVLKIDCIFRAVLRTQKNGVEGTEISHTLPAVTHVVSPIVRIPHQSGTFVTMMNLH